MNYRLSPHLLRIVVDYDFLFFLRSIDFEEDSVGMAVPDAVCTDRAAGINKVCVIEVWVKVFRIIPEFRILRLTFHRKSASKC